MDVSVFLYIAKLAQNVLSTFPNFLEFKVHTMKQENQDYLAMKLNCPKTISQTYAPETYSESC